MHPRLARADLLLAQSRPRDALAEVQQALTADPDDPDALLTLARCLSSLDRHAEALDAARRAVGLAPDEPFSHRVLAFALHRADREAEAEKAADEAVRLAPDEDNGFVLRASIRLARRRWADALADAEAALALNPENVEALNFRALALVQLGRPEDAHRTGDFALNRAPEDAMAHAVKGWACLHQSRPREARPHFLEALRLQPDLEYARHGMLEALKAVNPVYRGMLAYFLWMGRQSRGMQWAFILVTLFGVRFVRGIAAANPVAGYVLWPLIGLFYAFLFLTWTATPLFNLLLRFDRFGRHVLSRAERLASTLFGLSLLPLFAALGWWATHRDETGLIASIMTAMLSVCVAAGVVRRGRNRLILLGATGALAAAAGAVLFLGQTAWLTPFFLGFLGFQFLANALQD